MIARPRFLDRTTPPHIATLTVLAGISALTMNLYLPSLPGMTGYFGADYRVMQLSVALYLGVSALLQVVIGPISDRYGRRSVLLASLAIFMVATLGCILASTAEIFLAFRMLQAVVAAGMVLSRAAVRDMASDDQTASMLAYVTMGMALVPMVAPAIGGLIDTAFGWQGNFWLLFLVGGAVSWLVWRDLGETSAPRDGGFAAQFREYPELLASPRFWGYTVTAFLSAGAFYAYLGGAPFIGSEIYHLEPARLGLYFGSASLGYIFGNWASGRYAVRIGIDRMILWGTFVTSAGLATLLALHEAGFHSPLVFFGFMVPLGIGNGLVLPNAAAGALSVRPRLAGSASGLNGALLIGGGAMLSAYAGTLLRVDTGATPLIVLMLLSSLLSIVAIRLVIRRSARLAGAR